MKVTTRLFKRYVGGMIHLLNYDPEGELTFWVRGTLIDARVTGWRRSNQKLKIRVHSLTQLVDSELWVDLEPRSFIVPLDEYEAGKSNDLHLLIESICGTFVFQPPDSAPMRCFCLHIVDDEDPEGDEQLVRMVTSDDARDEHPFDELLDFVYSEM